MYNHFTPLPDRPEAWSHDWSTTRNVTDWDGKFLSPVLQPSRNYAKLWEKHKALLEAEVELRKGCDVRSFDSHASTNHHINLLHESER